MVFSDEEVYRAWLKANGRCQCRRIGHGHDSTRCNRPLLWLNRNVDAPGCWEALKAEDNKYSPQNNCEIFCIDCHAQAQKDGLTDNIDRGMGMTPKWNDNFASGIAEIDREHITIFDIINLFSKELNANRSQEELLKIFRGCVDYIRQHCEKEEELMKKYNYPGEKAHSDDHLHFNLKLSSWHRQADLGKLIISHGIVSDIAEWNLRHTVLMDKEMGTYLRRQGVR